MDTIRIILPAVITLFFSLVLIWIIAGYIKKYADSELGSDVPSTKTFKSGVNKIAWAITFLALFFSIWWLVTLLSVNEIPRNTIDRTLNNEMRNNFEDRMVADTTKKK